MPQMTKEIMDVFNDPKAIKILATVDENGVPNNVPVFTLCCVDKETLACADIYMAKTKKNLTLQRYLVQINIVQRNLACYTSWKNHKKEVAYVARMPDARRSIPDSKI
jgi:predicted pyridoxine 5'-phosphate oxidase superfamily flavin-nucleotide-binding protein